MHVFLTGATGFVGHYLLQELLRRGHTVRCLLREGSLGKLPVPADEVAVVDSSQAAIAAGTAPHRDAPRARVEVVYGDVTDLASVEGDLAGCDAVIHLVGIIDEDRRRGVTFETIHVRGTRVVVEQARAAGVRRFVHMSANGARPGDASPYHTTKWRAEEIVRAAGFPLTVVFRPSIVFGDPGEGRPEFASRLLRTLVRPFPILPVLGDGRYRLQPVHVTEVAAAFAQALELPEGPPRSYCAAGPETVTFDEALDRIAAGAGMRRKPKLHLPLVLAKALVNTAGRAGLLPISPAQFRMLLEGNTCDDPAFRADFDLTALPFTPEHLAYLRGRA